MVEEQLSEKHIEFRDVDMIVRFKRVAKDNAVRPRGFYKSKFVGDDESTQPTLAEVLQLKERKDKIKKLEANVKKQISSIKKKKKVKQKKKKEVEKKKKTKKVEKKKKIQTVEKKKKKHKTSSAIKKKINRSKERKFEEKEKQKY